MVQPAYPVLNMNNNLDRRGGRREDKTKKTGIRSRKSVVSSQNSLEKGKKEWWKIKFMEYRNGGRVE